MATWVGKITLSCPSGRVVRKMTGSPDAVIKSATHFDARKAGAGCSVEKIEIIKRGIGAGAPDRREGESPFGGWLRFGKKRSKRHNKKAVALRLFGKRKKRCR